MWNAVNPMVVASIWGFHEHPKQSSQWFQPLMRQIRAAMPNAAHLALAEMERNGWLKLLITQNIDGLHQLAGSQKVVELHGHLRSATCMQCPVSYTHLKVLATFTACWPVMESATKRISCGAVSRLISSNSCIISSLICRRPAVSRITTV